MASDDDMLKHCGKQACGKCPIRDDCTTYEAYLAIRRMVMSELFSAWLIPTAYLVGIHIGAYIGKHPEDKSINWNILLEAWLYGALWPVTVPYAIWINHKEAK